MGAAPVIVDAHEDIAWNALTFGRDVRFSAYETRAREARTQSLAPRVNGDTLLGWPEYQQGRVAVVFATLFAAPQRRRLGAWDTQYYADAEEAFARYREQAAYYHDLVEQAPDMFRLVMGREDLEAVLRHWATDEGEHPVGLVLLMEGAEGVRTPEDLPFWWEQGVRLIGPAWAGTRFCGGTREPGPLTEEGRVLLREMAPLGFVLDISHMDEAAVLEALDLYEGPVVATHANPKALLRTDSNRFLSDTVLRRLLERDGVVGIVPYNRFLDADWTPQQPRLPLQRVVEHVDYVCQLAGDARHVGLGTDFDGGFGVQSVPAEIDTVADLPALGDLLARRGYTEEDIAAVLGGNWLRVLRQALP